MRTFMLAGLVALAAMAGTAGYLAIRAAQADVDETTGSVGMVDARPLDLSDIQRERIYQAVRPFPNTTEVKGPPPEVTSEVSGELPLQDLPDSVTTEIPLLSRYKFVKLSDRILLINPSTRIVKGMIPRYRLFW
jgi:hypothetical protein